MIRDLPESFEKYGYCMGYVQASAWGAPLALGGDGFKAGRQARRWADTRVVAYTKGLPGTAQRSFLSVLPPALMSQDRLGDHISSQVFRRRKEEDLLWYDLWASRTPYAMITRWSEKIGSRLRIRWLDYLTKLSHVIRYSLSSNNNSISPTGILYYHFNRSCKTKARIAVSTKRWFMKILRLFSDRQHV